MFYVFITFMILPIAEMRILANIDRDHQIYGLYEELMSYSAQKYCSSVINIPLV